MKRFSEQFHTKSKSVSLSSTEKKELRERVVSYMEYHPLPAELKTSKKAVAKSPVLNEAFKTVSIPFSLFFKSSAVAAAFVLVVVPFMAEQSVPGDTLYAVKVQFNEEVRSTLTFDSYQKVEWETQRVNRRIAEARLLESEGRLTEEVEAEVAQAVRTHTQNAQKEIESLREFDAEEATIASIEFGSNLEAQAASFKETDEINQTDTAAVALKIKSVNLIADAVDESRALNEQPNASTTPSYAKLIARVEQNTTRMYELSDNLESLNPNTKADVARRIQDIERSVEKAIEEAPTNEREAREILVDVLKRTQKLIVFMTDLEVSESVDIEELVPVVLTDDEEALKITSFTNEVSQKRAEIEIAVKSATLKKDADFTEKIEDGLTKLAQLSEQMAATENYKEFKVYAQEAIKLADDLLAVLEKNNTPATTKPATETRASTTASTTEALPGGESPGTVVSSSTSGTLSTTSVDVQ